MFGTVLLLTRDNFYHHLDMRSALAFCHPLLSSGIKTAVSCTCKLCVENGFDGNKTQILTLGFISADLSVRNVVSNRDYIRYRIQFVDRNGALRTTKVMPRHRLPIPMVAPFMFEAGSSIFPCFGKSLF